MISGFFQPSHSTKINTCVDLKKPIQLINKLRLKESELKKSADQKGPSSIDFRKHLVIENLLEQIDKAISDFNDRKIDLTQDDEIRSTINLVNKLTTIISNIRNEENKTLSASRNKLRKRLSNAVYFSTFGATLTLGSALSIPALANLAALFYVAPQLSNSIWKETGLNDLSPTSIRILNELSNTLDEINKNLKKQVSLDSDLDNEKGYQNLICPITKRIIKDPVICLLDNHAYNRPDIEKWLEMRGTSPILTEIKMPKGKKPSEFLISNYNLTAILKDYRDSHPSIDEEESAEEIQYRSMTA